MAASRRNNSVHSRKRGGESGQALLEFALVATIIIIMALGVIDLSRAIFDKEVLSDLARTGSNLASRGPCEPCRGLRQRGNHAAVRFEYGLQRNGHRDGGVPTQLEPLRLSDSSKRAASRVAAESECRAAEPPFPLPPRRFLRRTRPST